MHVQFLTQNTQYILRIVPAYPETIWNLNLYIHNAEQL